tara:strand:- start:476 stop:649 length:174 start_codon:yes stop_codon:yes gene_type:complete
MKEYKMKEIKDSLQTIETMSCDAVDSDNISKEDMWTVVYNINQVAHTALCNIKLDGR